MFPTPHSVGTGHIHSTSLPPDWLPSNKYNQEICMFPIGSRPWVGSQTLPISFKSTDNSVTCMKPLVSRFSYFHCLSDKQCNKIQISVKAPISKIRAEKQVNPYIHFFLA
jgi:hypothetical protein